ncbi:hypothetical protein [Alkalimarinus coralli]|nr:hypothetical protein [Alkalimarinus coralli]
MSSDFVVDSLEKDKPGFAIQLKSKEAYSDPGTIEKLELERVEVTARWKL